MLEIVDNKVAIRGSHPVIGSKHQPGNATHSVDGVYWERLPYVEPRLQSALIDKGTKRKRTLFQMIVIPNKH